MGIKIACAMSGGVDSSVSAYILKREGYDVEGFSLRLVDPCGKLHGKRCCTIEDIFDAKSVCEAIGIPHHIIDMEPDFRTSIVEPFIAEYKNGRTPNPCISCNTLIKFGALLNYVNERGFSHLASGHYARIKMEGGMYQLLKGKDKRKDQSYFLFTLSKEQMQCIIFPVGNYTKEEIRKIAKEAGLPVAKKQESQDICFVPEGGYRILLEEGNGSGPILSEKGEVIGSHKGYYNFTIGQRRGIRIAAKNPLYVLSIDPVNHAVTVAPKESLKRKFINVSRCHWINPFYRNLKNLSVRIRYMSPEIPCLIYENNEVIVVKLKKEAIGICPGQAAVFYNGEEVIGGGWID